MLLDMFLRLCLGVLAVAVAVAGRSASADPPEKPNILLILVDDLRYDALSHHGHPYAVTPNLDRLAREGASFSRAYTVSPLCTASRASFLTGQYPHKSGVRDNFDVAPVHDGSALLSFPMLFARAGYATAFIGKWHFGETGAQPRPGFDHWAGFQGQGRYEDPILNVDGVTRKFEGYVTDVVTDLALEFLAAPRTRPFLLYVSHKAVHGPFTPAARHAGLHADESAAGKGREREQIRTLMAVDEGVGRLLEALERKGVLDETLVVLAGDSGIHWSRDPRRRVKPDGDKRSPYELDAVRIPLLLRFPPRIAPGTSSSALVANIDVAPTLLALGGIAVPADVDGRALWPLLGALAAPWRESLLLEYWRDAWPAAQDIDPWRAVVTEQWKLIDREGRHPTELYDLRADPREEENLGGTGLDIESLLRTEMTRLFEALRAREPAGARALAVNAVADRSAIAGTRVALVASATRRDADSRPTFQWQPVSGPPLAHELEEPGLLATHARLGAAGDYRFRIAVWDDSAVATDELVVTAVGPRHYFPFDENLDDTLQGIRGVSRGGAAIAVAGGVDRALFLAGGEGRLELRHGDLERSLVCYSVTLWFRANALDGTQLIYEEGGSENGLGLRLAGARLEGAVSAGGRVARVGVEGVRAGVWHQATLTFDAGRLAVYLDGAVASAETDTGFAEIPRHANPAGLGGPASSTVFDALPAAAGAAHLAGFIDALAIYNAVTLGPGEIADLYASGRQAREPVRVDPDAR